jgi:uncharacterized membrane protein
MKLSLHYSLLIISYFLFLFSHFLFPKVTLAQDLSSGEAATAFNSQITINQNTSVSISETISYYTPIEKHGIYRYIPLKYNRGNYVSSMSINRITITDGDGLSIPYSTSRENGNFIIKIGDPNQTFTGQKTYRIAYTLSDALNRFTDHDELYWDITGEGWQFPIEHVSATIASPFALINQSACYAGPVGSDNHLCEISKSTSSKAEVKYPEVVNYGDNVTIALFLPHPNQLIFPSLTDRLLQNLIDNFALIFLPLPLLIMFMAWYKWGRDYEFISPNVFDLDPDKPQRLKPIFEPKRIPFVYEPLKDLTPTETGAMLDESVDNRDIVADIIDLARRKFLKLEASEKTGFLSSTTEYTFTKLKDADDSLHPHQLILYSKIFDDRDVVKLSDLKGSFYTTMEQAKKSVNDQLTKHHLYMQNPSTSRGLGITLAIILNFLVLLIAAPTFSFLNSFLLVAIFGVMALMSIIFGAQLVQKSAVGNNLSMQAKGLQQTIRLGKWREEIKEKHLFIEEILPYAIALGVIDKLANDMKALNLKPPEYFQSAGFVGGNWYGLVNSFTTVAATQLSYNPSSSRASSGSGFSGGFSGGGGGGGGGGSW